VLTAEHSLSKHVTRLIVISMVVVVVATLTVLIDHSIAHLNLRGQTLIPTVDNQRDTMRKFNVNAHACLATRHQLRLFVVMGRHVLVRECGINRGYDTLVVPHHLALESFDDEHVVAQERTTDSQRIETGQIGVGLIVLVGTLNLNVLAVDQPEMAFALHGELISFPIFRAEQSLLYGVHGTAMAIEIEANDVWISPDDTARTVFLRCRLGRWRRIAVVVEIWL